jgi:hypothetical protein
MWVVDWFQAMRKVVVRSIGIGKSCLVWFEANEQDEAPDLYSRCLSLDMTSSIGSSIDLTMNDITTAHVTCIQLFGSSKSGV